MKTIFAENPRDESQGIRFRKSDFESAGWRIQRMIRYRTVGGKLSDWIPDPAFQAIVGFVEPVSFGGFRYRLSLYENGFTNLLLHSFDEARRRAVDLIFGVNECDPSDSSK